MVAADQFNVSLQQQMQLLDGIHVQENHITKMRVEPRSNQLQNRTDNVAFVFKMPVNGGRHNAHFLSHGSDIQGPDTVGTDDIQRCFGNLVLSDSGSESVFGHHPTTFVNIYSHKKLRETCQDNNGPCSGRPSRPWATGADRSDSRPGLQGLTVAPDHENLS